MSNTLQELTAAKGPNWERKEEKSRSCTVEVPSAARDITSSTWASQKNVTSSMRTKIRQKSTSP